MSVLVSLPKDFMYATCGSSQNLVLSTLSACHISNYNHVYAILVTAFLPTALFAFIQRQEHYSYPSSQFCKKQKNFVKQRLCFCRGCAYKSSSLPKLHAAPCSKKSIEEDLDVAVKLDASADVAVVSLSSAEQSSLSL